MLKVIFSLCLISTCALAYPDSNTTTTVKTGKQTTKKNLKKLSQWSLVVPSFVIHGIAPTAEASLEMPRRIDKGGNSVITPGLGIKYEGSSGQMFVAGIVKDCYDHLAGALQYGFYSQLTNESRWGLTFGIYARETPVSCETTRVGNFQTTECHDMDKYDFKFQTLINGTVVDIIPMPFLHYSTLLYKDSDLAINFKLMSNFFLNEFAIAVPF